MSKSHNSRRKEHSSKPRRPQGLNKLLDICDIDDDAWDFLLVGDGSGSAWGQPAGWGCVSIERETMERKIWAGCVSSGTVNFGEIMAYLQPLTWLANREEDRRKNTDDRRRALKIYIITDSQYCRDTGQNRNRVLAKNAALWSAFDAFVRQGLVLYWRWLRREECELNTYADEISKLARRSLLRYNLLERLASDEDTVYDVNPSGPAP